MTIDYDRFTRYVSRCLEIVNEKGMNPVVVAVYNDALKAPATAYLDAVAKVASATTAFEKENKEALQALGALDSPYLLARAAVEGVHPETLKALPETLKSCATDTDKRNAITKLVDIIDDYAGEAWADALLNGEFATKAASALKEITEAISANTSLTDAELSRATAYGPAYEKYISFKQVVRAALGPGSKHYRRIHMRASPGAADEEQDTAAPQPKSPEAAKPGGGAP